MLFEEDVSIAAITGFRLWEASHTFAKMLGGPWRDLVRGKKCIELGCGTGLVGLAAAALGGHVLLTDVPSVVRDTAGINVARNGKGE